MSLFRDRRSAGSTLGKLVRVAAHDKEAVVLALPRGGVPVGFEVANALQIPLDVCVVRKLGMPGEEELALGALASGGVRVLNRDLIDALQVSNETIEFVTNRERLELERREELYRQGRPPVPVEGRTVILVDDGLATGATMLAAVRSLRDRVGRIVIAVPVAAAQTCKQLRSEVASVVCAANPHLFESVGKWYQDFSPVSDEEVRLLLQQGTQKFGAGEPISAPEIGHPH